MKKLLSLLFFLGLLAVLPLQASAQIVVASPATDAAIVATSQEIVAAVAATESLAQAGNSILDGVLGNLDEYVNYARSAIQITNNLIAVYGASKEFILNLKLTSAIFNEYYQSLEILGRCAYLFNSGEINYIIYCLDYAAFGITAEVEGLERTIKGIVNIAGGALSLLQEVYQAVSGGNINIITIRNSIREATATIRHHHQMVFTVKGFIQRSIILKKLELGYYEDMQNTREIRKKLNIE